jgi:hypothetical protein
MSIDKLWLPTGPTWDLNIEHKPLEDAGEFTGGGHGLVWHTTESERESVDAMWHVLRAKNAAPHVVIGWREGFRYPVAIQCIPFNRAGRALAHPSGPETNRANKIQVEICGRAAESHTWDANWYKALANLALLIEHRVDIPRKAPRSFPGTRYTGTGFVRAQGHIGHCHAPGNDHSDPGRFASARLLRFMRQGKQELKPR